MRGTGQETGERESTEMNLRTAAAEGPKYRHIYDRLRHDIASAAYPPGSRLPSEAELVKRFSASRPTVGRALAELVSEGWIERKAGSGTYVCGRAEKKTPTFGLLIPELGITEIFEPICQGISHARIGGHHDLLWGPLFDPRAAKEVQAERLSEHYLRRDLSGIFFAPMELSEGKDEVNRRILRTFDEARIPIVLLDRDVCDYPERSKYDLVGIDNRRAGLVITQHLLSQGVHRILFFTRPHLASTVPQRIQGFREALRLADQSWAEEPVCYGDPGDRETVRRLLAERRPEAIVCPNDITAAQLMSTLSLLGVQVPAQVKITGMDDVKYASLLHTPLTTIHQPCAAIGATAMMAMLDRVERPNQPARDFFVDFELVVRRSSANESNSVDKREAMISASASVK